jgi:hypothetical protein
MNRRLLLLVFGAAAVLTASLVSEDAVSPAAPDAEEATAAKTHQSPPKLKAAPVGSATEQEVRRTQAPSTSEQSPTPRPKSAPSKVKDASRTSDTSSDKAPTALVVTSRPEYLVLDNGGWPVQTLLLRQGNEPLAHQVAFPTPGERLRRIEPPAEDSPILPKRQARSNRGTLR